MIEDLSRGVEANVLLKWPVIDRYLYNNHSLQISIDETLIKRDLLVYINSETYHGLLFLNQNSTHRMLWKYSGYRVFKAVTICKCRQGVPLLGCPNNKSLL